MGSLKDYFHGLADGTQNFFSSPQVGETHIFTDGSCFAEAENSLFHTAAWATVDASTGRVIAAAPLHGLPQTIGRAELVAIIAGLEWCHRFNVVAHFWCDSLFVAKGLATLVALGDIPAHWEHFDLWLRALALLELVPLGTQHIHWIPSHLDPLLCESPFESWVAHWNAMADRGSGRGASQPTTLLWVLAAAIGSSRNGWGLVGPDCCSSAVLLQSG